MGNALTALASRVATPCLVDRTSGRRILEPNPPLKALRMWFLYHTWVGRLLLALPLTWWLLTWQHHRVAAYADSPRSKKDIPGFIKTYQVDAGAAEKPPGHDPSVAVNPADGRCVVYGSVDDAHRFWIKGTRFSVHKLLGPGYETQDHWRQATLAIHRLSPSDIHRLHASVPGTVTKIRRRGNKFMGSEFTAIHSHSNVLTENDRLVVEIESEAFGPVVQVMVGASEVGSVVPLVKEGAAVNKGDEVAFFAYGGSIMLTLFRHGAISFDDDLLVHSRARCETLVTFGSSLGRATSRAGEAPAGQQ